MPENQSTDNHFECLLFTFEELPKCKKQSRQNFNLYLMQHLKAKAVHGVFFLEKRALVYYVCTSSNELKQDFSSELTCLKQISNDLNRKLTMET